MIMTEVSGDWKAFFIPFHFNCQSCLAVKFSKRDDWEFQKDIPIISLLRYPAITIHFAKLVIKCKYFDNHIVSRAEAFFHFPSGLGGFEAPPPTPGQGAGPLCCVQNYFSVRSLPQITVALHNSSKLCPPLNSSRATDADPRADSDSDPNTEARTYF